MGRFVASNDVLKSSVGFESVLTAAFHIDCIDRIRANGSAESYS